MNFELLGLAPQLLKAVEQLGFKHPMPIQAQAIPVLLTGKNDMVGLAQTGTGKTGAFGLPLLQRIDPAIAGVQGIVLCPTRELCIQITSDLNQFARYLNHIQIVAVYGGASIANQIRQLKRGAQIIVATPGRLIDLINRRAADLSQIGVAVLDEADEMLNMGFQEDIEQILGRMPTDRKTWLFSATMPSTVARIAQRYLTDPINISVNQMDCGLKSISHTYYVVHEKNRYAALKRIVDFTPDMFGLIFCRTRKDTQSIAESLIADGCQAEALHGDLSQAQRDYVMRKFRKKTIRVLVATDVAARGLDVDDITHVIHYNLPDEAEGYTHRSGRTARAGKSGISMALVNTRENRRIRELEKRCKIRFEFGQLPDGKAICQKQVLGLVQKLEQTQVDEAVVADYLPEACEALQQLDKTDLIKRLIAGELNRLIDDNRLAEDINARKTTPRRPQTAKGAGAKTSRRPHSPRPTTAPDRQRLKGKSTQRFFINVGRLDKINEGAIVRLICSNSGIRSSMIGQINLNREFSFFEVEKRAARQVFQSVQNAMLDGRVIQLKKAERKTDADKTRRP